MPCNFVQRCATLSMQVIHLSERALYISLKMLLYFMNICPDLRTDYIVAFDFAYACHVRPDPVLHCFPSLPSHIELLVKNCIISPLRQVS